MINGWLNRMGFHFSNCLTQTIGPESPTVSRTKAITFTKSLTIDFNLTNFLIMMPKYDFNNYNPPKC